MDLNKPNFYMGKLDDEVPEFDYSRYVVAFVDRYFDVVDFDKKPYTTGRPPYDERDMFKLIVYAYSQGVTSSKVISEFARYHIIYRYVCNGIKPSEATIRKFVREKGYLFNPLLGCSLFFANELGITDFDYIVIDGTIKKANNNKYNVMNQKTITTLINYYEGNVLPHKKIKKLPRPAIKFIERTDMNDDDKLDLLYDMETQLTLSGQNTVPVNDIEARWMYNKQKIKEPLLNVQSAVDTMSKLICAVKVSQKPTDHYLLPEIVEKAIGNIKSELEYVSADTGYHTETSIQYLQNKKITGLIPDRKQTRKNRNKLSTNPFHKDNFEYNYEKDVFICPNKEELSLYKEIEHYNNESELPYKIERRYMNYEACKNCKDKEKCHKSTQRQITEFASPMGIEMKRILDSEQGKELFKKRSSTVEAPFGTLKIQYHINDLPITGVQHTEHILSLLALTYNLKRLYNIMENIYTKTDDIKKFIEKIETLLNLKCKIKEIE